MASNKHVQLSNIIFKSIIAQSLPEMWDTYTCPYLADDTMSSQQLMGLIREEYHHRVSHTKMSESVNQARADKVTLANRLDAPQGPKKMSNSEKCRQCGKKGHTTDKCQYIGQIKCLTCDRFSHTPANCWFKEWPPKCKGGKDKNCPGKKPKNENVNVVNEDEKKSSTDTLKKGMMFCVVEDIAETSAKIKEITEEVEEAVEWANKENITLGDNSVYNYTNLNPDIQLYDWIADSVTASHVANNHKIFTTYEELCYDIRLLTQFLFIYLVYYYCLVI